MSPALWSVIDGAVTSTPSTSPADELQLDRLALEVLGAMSPPSAGRHGVPEGTLTS